MKGQQIDSISDVPGMVTKVMLLRVDVGHPDLDVPWQHYSASWRVGGTGTNPWMDTHSWPVVCHPDRWEAVRRWLELDVGAMVTQR